MDRIVLAAVTALAGAVAGDAWRQVHEAIAGLWRRGHSPQQADTIGAEVDQLREQLLQARRDGDTGTEHALEGGLAAPVLLPGDATRSAVGPRYPRFVGGGAVYDRHDRFVAGEGERVEALHDRRSCGTGAAGPVSSLAGGVSRALVSASVDAGDRERKATGLT
jgi:hypothetical protein